MIGQAGAHKSLREALALAGQRFGRATLRRDPAGDDPTMRREFWALRDVSFQVQQGEVVGMIGDNGAGKSTLLKILSRITEPTEGELRYRGRVGSLLEVGTGFHPELSGRDNIFLSGAILGMTRSEIMRRYDEIVAFSEIGDFIDTPVKRYSSGMYMRLAFAVAAHLDVDILLIDEVLAVGDVRFQRKCLSRVDKIADAGKTIIFVSHNLVAVQSICRRTLWIDRGRVVADGPSADVVKAFMRVGHLQREDDRVWPDPAMAPGNARIRLRRACVEPLAELAPGMPIDTRTPLRIVFEYDNHVAGARLAASLSMINADDAVVFSAWPTQEIQPRSAGSYREECRIPGDLMNDGNYRVTFEVRDEGKVILRCQHVLSFDVADSSDFRFGWYGKWEGAVRPLLDWSTTQVPELKAAE
ncbi:MAG TPA: polysaccharide ABC transporter ATP-binding protein [Vicinamibacterales bacterium]|nr:polysaccharide ABC transporter ATP-binding protein [Vicinamibacterales bacterium]